MLRLFWHGKRPKKLLAPSEAKRPVTIDLAGEFSMPRLACQIRRLELYVFPLAMNLIDSL